MHIASTRVIVLLAFLLLPASACTTTSKAPETTGLSAVRMAASPELSKAAEDFREARYQSAFDQAKAVSRSSGSPIREQAAWIAGLSAYQMQNLDEAELQFMAAARSQDPRLVTDTKIMMGDIRVLQKRWSDAARCYRDAAQSLSGEERARVLSYAEVSDSYARGSSGATAAAPPPSGSSASRPPAGASTAGASRPDDGPSSFSLQAGAFQNERNARRRATEIASSTRSAGLGEPRVVRTRDPGGREYWAVQVGTFSSRQSAESARTKVPSLELIVAAAG